MSTISIKSNIPSLAAQRRLGDSTRDINQAFERLSSGLRINRAVDDAAGLAIASGLNVDARVYATGIRNLNDGLSLLNIADGAITELSNITIRIRELAEQSANGTLSNSQRKALDEEAQELAKEFTRIAQTSEFNDLALFDGTLGELSLQAGYGTNGAVASGLGGAIGDGTFGAGTSYATESLLSWAGALGDLNGDGILDLVTAGENDGNDGYATVQLGQGDGSFGAATSYASESRASYSITLGDLNGDGVLDLVTAGRSDGNDAYNTVRLGVGDGTFGAAVSYAYQTELYSSNAVTLEDLNGDGVLDLVTAGFTDSSDGYAAVRLGVGDGSFGTVTSYATESYSSYAMTLGDLNGDGVLDLVTGGETDGNDGYATIRLGQGDGSFGAATSYVTESRLTEDVILEDINGDGVLDLVTAGATDGNDGYATVRLGVGDGSFGTAASYATESFSSLAVTLGDINGDGVLDLVTAGRSDGFDGYATIQLGQGDGSFGAATSYVTESVFSQEVMLGDINGDGVLDLVTAGRADGDDGYATALFGNTEDGISPIVPFSLATQADALQAMGPLDRKIESLASQRGVIGAFQSRVQVAVNNLEISTTSIKEAESRIRDIDVATESARLTRLNILQQAGSAILAQANIGPELALRLLEDA